MITGDIIGSYRLVKRLGVGGMAVVWQAEHTGMHTQHALKFLAEHLIDSADAVRRFEQEARIGFELGTHAHIVRTTDLFMFGRRPVMVQDLANGCTLQELVNQHPGPWPWHQAWRLMRPVVEAMAVAHRAKIVHRDLKPSNILVETDGTDTRKGVAKIIDLGIARDLDKASMTRTGAELGSYIFMSPEQFDDPRAAGPSADVYSMAVVLWWLLAGRLPADPAKPREMIEFYRASAPFPIPSSLPSQIAVILAQALRHDPTLRPQDATELLTALDTAENQGISRRVPTATPAGELPPEHRSRSPDAEQDHRSRPANTSLGFVVVALAVLAVGLGAVVVNSIYKGWALEAERLSKESDVSGLGSGAGPASSPIVPTPGPGTVERSPSSAAAAAVWRSMQLVLPKAVNLNLVAARAAVDGVEGVLGMPDSTVSAAISEISISDVRPWLRVAKINAKWLPDPELSVETFGTKIGRIGKGFDDTAKGCAAKTAALGAPQTREVLACGGALLTFALGANRLLVYQPGTAKPTCEWWLYPPDAYRQADERTVHDAYSCNDAAVEAYAGGNWPVAQGHFEAAVRILPTYGRAWLRYCLAAERQSDRGVMLRACSQAALSHFDEVRSQAKAALAR